MSDRERFLAFIQGAGFTEQESSTIVGDGHYQLDDNDVLLGSSKGEGYSCFFSRWTFDESGKFVSVGHYE